MVYNSKQKQAQKSGELYLKNQKKIKARMKERKQNIQKFVQIYKEETPCSDCKNRFPYYVMDFDHVGEKNFELNKAVGRGFSLTRIVKEMALCEIVCSNCHRERTQNRML